VCLTYLTHPPPSLSTVCPCRKTEGTNDLVAPVIIGVLFWFSFNPGEQNNIFYGALFIAISAVTVYGLTEDIY
jgi:hypothetical protein